MLCTGQSNMQIPTWFADNASAELPAAEWPLIRIAQVQRSWAATTPQADTPFSISWVAVNPDSISQFSALCYYFGRELFLRLGGQVPIGLIEADQGGTYIESFMPEMALAHCNTTGKRPADWLPVGPLGPQTLDPWGEQNTPAALWNTMLSPLRALNLKLVLYDQAEHNLATRESRVYRCLQNQLVGVLRQAWGAALTFHLIQLPSFNMSEFAYTFVDSLGEMRLSQIGTIKDLIGVTTTVTIDLADLHSPWGSVHNRQKQIVGRRAALHALATGYGQHGLNTGPTLLSAIRQNTSLALRIVSHGGSFVGANDCIQCCNQSAFETSTDDKTWTRVRADKVSAGPDPTNATVFDISLMGAVPLGATLWLRYAYDDLIQCLFVDANGIPLPPFRICLKLDDVGHG